VQGGCAQRVKRRAQGPALQERGALLGGRALPDAEDVARAPTRGRRQRRGAIDDHGVVADMGGDRLVGRGLTREGDGHDHERSGRGGFLVDGGAHGRSRHGRAHTLGGALGAGAVSGADDDLPPGCGPARRETGALLSRAADYRYGAHRAYTARGWYSPKTRRRVSETSPSVA
jgi:hypothetical protein